MNVVEADGTAISVESHAKSYRATNIECVQIMHQLSGGETLSTVAQPATNPLENRGRVQTTFPHS